MGPAWTRPQSGPSESPPWSGSQDAAPWQTPPQYAGATRPPAPSRPEPSPSPDRLAAEPPRPPSAYPSGVAKVLVVLLAVEAVLATVYGIFAVAPRRGVFAALASDPSSVTRAAAEQSDAINLVLFLCAGLGALATVVLVPIWRGRARRTQPPVSVGLPTTWWVLAVAGLAAVVVALVLHVSSSPGQIAVGYVIMGIGALAVAVAAAWAIPLVRHTGRAAAAAHAAMIAPARPPAAAS